MKLKLGKYQKLNREIEELYDKFIEKSKLPSSEYWSLFMIFIGVQSQNEIGKALYLSKQTVNTAVKNLINKGLIVLEQGKNLKTKNCVLTEKGIRFCDKFIGAMFLLENEVWDNLNDKEQKTLIGLTEKYILITKKHIDKFLPESEEN